MEYNVISTNPEKLERLDKNFGRRADTIAKKLMELSANISGPYMDPVTAEQREELFKFHCAMTFGDQVIIIKSHEFEEIEDTQPTAIVKTLADYTPVMKEMKEGQAPRYPDERPEGKTVQQLVRSRIPMPIINKTGPGLVTQAKPRRKRRAVESPSTNLLNEYHVAATTPSSNSEDLLDADEYGSAVGSMTPISRPGWNSNRSTPVSVQTYDGSSRPASLFANRQAASTMNTPGSTETRASGPRLLDRLNASARRAV